jgi:hypothetical protein
MEQAPLVARLDGVASALTDAAMRAVGDALAPEAGAVASIAVAGTVGARHVVEATVEVALAPGAARDLAADGPLQVLASTRHPDGSLATATVLLTVPDVSLASVVRVGLRDAAGTGPVSVTDDGVTVTLADASTGLRARVDRESGALVGLSTAGVEWLAGPSLGIERWSDDGGLYRIGSETTGCEFTPLGPLDGAAVVEVVERGPARARVTITRGDAVTTVAMSAGTGRLDVGVLAAAADRETLTARVRTSVAGATARYVHAAGSVTRPVASLYTPHFWPVVRAMDLVRPDGSGLAVLPRASTGIARTPDGTLDVMVSRNAPVELCDVLGETGTEAVHRPIGLALVPHAAPIDALAEAMALLPAPAAAITGTGRAEPASLVALGGRGWVLSALTHATRGAGAVLRVERSGTTATLDVSPGLLTPSATTRIDRLARGAAPATFPLVLDAPVVTLRLAP